MRLRAAARRVVVEIGEVDEVCSGRLEEIDKAWRRDEGSD